MDNELTAIPIQGFPKYKIDKNGNVYSFKRSVTKRLTPFANNCGELQVRLFKKEGKHKTFLLKKLVYETFKKETRAEIYFEDGNKSNCRLENLVLRI